MKNSNVTRGTALWRPGIPRYAPEVLKVEYMHNRGETNQDGVPVTGMNMIFPGLGEGRRVAKELLRLLTRDGIGAVIPFLPFEAMVNNDATLEGAMRECGLVVADHLELNGLLELTGHSAGGGPVAMMKRHSPERVKTAAFIAPAGMTNPHEQLPSKFRRVARLVANLVGNAFLVDMGERAYREMALDSISIASDAVHGRLVPKCDYATRAHLEEYALDDPNGGPSSILIVGEDDGVFRLKDYERNLLKAQENNPTKTLPPRIITKGYHETMPGKNGYGQILVAEAFHRGMPVTEIHKKYATRTREHYQAGPYILAAA